MNETNALLVQGFKAAKEGQRESAYSIFCEVVNRDPNNELGWLYRAAATDDLSEAYVCLQRVLSLNPANTKAQRGLERIQSRIEEEAGGPIATKTEEAAPPPTRSNPPTEGVKIAENEVVSGFGYNQPNGDYSGTQPTNQVFNPPQNVVPFPTTNRPGPTIPPFGAPPPFKDMPADDDNEVVTDIFDRTDTQPRYNMPPPMPPTRSFPTINVPASEDEEDIGSQFSSDPNQPNFTAPSYDDEPDFAALREEVPPPKRGLFGLGSRKEEPRLQQFGGRTNTNLDERGVQRQKKTRRNLLFVFVLLLAVVIILIAALVLRNNNTVVDTGGDNLTAVTTVTVDTTNGTGTTVAATTTTVGIATTQAPTTTARPQTTTAAPATTAANPTTVAPTTVANQAAPTAAPVPTPAGRAIIYAVRGGDNLTNLAKTYNTSAEAIVAANRDPAALDQNGPLISGTAPNYQIYANTRLVIPVQRADFRGRATIVKQGDTLDSIANRFKVAPADILKLNGYAAAGDIKAGEPLLLP